ncbi:MAG: hypothetical protein HYV90_02980 [Candidatus Woesebacteria bacterium]|nr:MAG: hypothetical protein HYV90_02980 [Candidatus Woesebacteria bacterium]
MKIIVLGILGLCFLGFVLVGAILFFGHAGLGIKAANYLFIFLCFGVAFKYLFYE